MTKPAVLITGGDSTLRRSLKSLLQAQGFLVSDSDDREVVVQSLQKKNLNLLVFLHAKEDAAACLEFLKEIRRTDEKIPIILITKESTEDLAIAALKVGIADYYKQPFLFQDFMTSVSRCLCSRSPNPARSNRTQTRSGLVGADRMVGDSQSLWEVKRFIKHVALTDSTVLITGETGTGKELAAELIHLNSPRQKHPFVSVNCVAIPDTLLESELFGHERGAFTGALASRDGLFQTAEGGTVFLDEIGDMNPLAQAKILRAIESREVCRLGGKKRIALDIRIIAATNQNLEQALAEGKFRKDLYYRLNVARLHLPPLRDRRGDIPLLLDYFLGELNRRCGREVLGCTDEALDYLVGYSWPGNVRELKNLLEATYINLFSNQIDLADLPKLFREQLHKAGAFAGSERDRLVSALTAANWNKSKAAQQLQWSRMTLYRKMEKYHIETSSPKTPSHPQQPVNRYTKCDS